MRRLSFLLFGLALFGGLNAPAFGQAKKEEFKVPPRIAAPPAPCFKHLDGQMLVFVANGVGGSTTVSDNLLNLNSEKQLGLRIQMVPWCRHNSLLQDLIDHEAQLNAAARIACSVSAIRRGAPNAHIYFVGHSAGARVVLAAAEMLPPHSVDRIILLASAVSCSYDLTSALRTSRGGIDHFWSSEDGVLDHERAHDSTADGQKTPAAGRVGFHLVSADKKDIAAYCNLRQHRWNEEFCGSGGHFAWTIRHNMKKVIVPLFFTEPAPPPAATIYGASGCVHATSTSPF